MIVGNATRFAIETEITEIYAAQRPEALGTLIVHVASKEYGYRTPDSTTLGFPLWHLQQRLLRRGKHVASFSEVLNASMLVDVFLEAEYGITRLFKENLNMSGDEISTILGNYCINWQPDGDEAFDDGSNIYQFDIGDRVRVIACKNEATEKDRCVSEIWMPSDEFYNILDEWQRRFEHELRTTPVGVKPKAV